MVCECWVGVRFEWSVCGLVVWLDLDYFEVFFVGVVFGICLIDWDVFLVCVWGDVFFW